MKKFLKNTTTGLTCLIEVIVGIFLLVNAHAFLQYLMLIAGVIVSVLGVISLIKYFVAKPEDAEKGALTSALTMLTLGVVLIIYQGFIVNLDAYLAYIIGAVILYSGYQKLESMVEKIRNKKFFIVSLISALLTIAFAAIVFFLKGNAVWIFVGVTLLVEGGIDLVDMIVGAVKGKEKKENKPIEAEAEEAPSEEE